MKFSGKSLFFFWSFWLTSFESYLSRSYCFGPWSGFQGMTPHWIVAMHLHHLMRWSDDSCSQSKWVEFFVHYRLTGRCLCALTSDWALADLDLTIRHCCALGYPCLADCILKCHCMYRRDSLGRTWTPLVYSEVAVGNSIGSLTRPCLLTWLLPGCFWLEYQWPEVQVMIRSIVCLLLALCQVLVYQNQLLS